TIKLNNGVVVNASGYALVNQVLRIRKILAVIHGHMRKDSSETFKNRGSSLILW
ncbi:putative beta-glucosidase, partial [Dissostichus eleginoides]